MASPVWEFRKRFLSIQQKPFRTLGSGWVPVSPAADWVGPPSTPIECSYGETVTYLNCRCGLRHILFARRPGGVRLPRPGSRNLQEGRTRWACRRSPWNEPIAVVVVIAIVVVFVPLLSAVAVGEAVEDISA